MIFLRIDLQNFVQFKRY